MGAFFYKLGYHIYKWRWPLSVLGAVLFVLFCAWAIWAIIFSVETTLINDERQPEIAVTRQLNHILNEPTKKDLVRISGDNATYTYQQLSHYRYRHITVTNFSDDQGGGGNAPYFVGNIGKYKGAGIWMHTTSKNGKVKYSLVRIEIYPGSKN